MNMLAVIAARNESLHIGRCIRSLTDEGLEVILIDHGSSDGTRDIAEAYLGNGLLKIMDLAWEGYFSLEKQLSTKKLIIDECKHEWVAHFDADEWPVASDQFCSLHCMAEEANNTGYSVINFNEFVFLPLPKENFEHFGYESRMNHYYFFEPSYPRLQRMWQRSLDVSNITHGGHRLSGDVAKLFPFDGILRHYIALSESHAIDKYANRIFADHELKRGWHSNRVNITEDTIKHYFEGNINYHSRLNALSNPLKNSFDKSKPQKLHFWEWPSGE
jgi:glycosyltransferase involved in cell wall biosynthesis